MRSARERFQSRLNHAPVIAVVKTEETGDAFRVASACLTAGFQLIAFDSHLEGACDLVAAFAGREEPAIGLWHAQSHDIPGLIDAGGSFFSTSDPSLAQPAQDLAAIIFLDDPANPPQIEEASGTPLLCLKDATHPMHTPHFKHAVGTLPGCDLMVSGPIGGDDVGAWLEAGARAVCLSTALYSSDLIAAGDFRTIRHYAAAVHREAAQYRTAMQENNA